MVFMNFVFVKSHGADVVNIPKQFRKIILIRGFAGFCGIAGIFNGVKYLPVATANCIIMTNPMWVAVLSFLILGESITKIDFVSIVLAFLGIVLINDPLNWNGLEDKEEAKGKLIGVICCLTAAISGAVAFVCMRFMKTDIHFAVSPFWYALACTLFSPIGATAIGMRENEMTTVYDL